MTIKALLRLNKIKRTLAYYRIDELLYEAFPSRALKLFMAFHVGKKIDPSCPRGERINKALEALGPIFIKFGQLLSTRPDLFPEDISTSLNKLQSEVTPFSVLKVKEIIQRDLGDIQSLFSYFEEKPLASASIAQVHRATLITGEKVVLKVKRPNIEAQILSDLKWLKLSAKAMSCFIKPLRRFKPVEVIEDLQQTLMDELNFQREAANANQLGRNFENSPLLYVPTIYWDQTKGDIITMEEIHGIPVTHVDDLKAKNVNLKLLAERGVEIFFTQVFRDSFFHADMHPGNIYVDVTKPELPRYFALDCAIIGTLTESDQRYLAENLIAFFTRDYQQVAKLHIESGWVPPDTSEQAFESAIRTVCEPIFAKPLKDISFGQTLYNLFSVAKKFNMEVQPQLILLQKTLLSIEGLGRQLYPELDLWQTAHPYLERWIKQRYHPKHAFRLMKKHLPYMLDLLPELPKLSQALVNTLKVKTPLEQKKSKTYQSNRMIVAITGSTFVLTSAVVFALVPGNLGLSLAGISFIYGLYQLKLSNT